jgi:hypothetical protein
METEVVPEVAEKVLHGDLTGQFARGQAAHAVANNEDPMTNVKTKSHENLLRR